MLVGITGAGGSGKSSLIDHLIEGFRKRDLRVGVVAVDPSSPFSGGALLGDRIREIREGRSDPYSVVDEVLKETLTWNPTRR